MKDIRDFLKTSIPTVPTKYTSVYVDEDESRAAIPAHVKREVYNRFNKRCESCGMKLLMNQGQFHHLRSPTVKPTAKTIQFLCRNCHGMYGHKIKQGKFIRIKVRKRRRKVQIITKE